MKSPDELFDTVLGALQHSERGHSHDESEAREDLAILHTRFEEMEEVVEAARDIHGHLAFDSRFTFDELMALERALASLDKERP